MRWGELEKYTGLAQEESWDPQYTRPPTLWGAVCIVGPNLAGTEPPSLSITSSEEDFQTGSKTKLCILIKLLNASSSDPCKQGMGPQLLQ